MKYIYLVAIILGLSCSIQNNTDVLTIDIISDSTINILNSKTINNSYTDSIQVFDYIDSNGKQSLSYYSFNYIGKLNEFETDRIINYNCKLYLNGILIDNKIGSSNIDDRFINIILKIPKEYQ